MAFNQKSDGKRALKSGDDFVHDKGTEAIREAQRAARESMAAKQKPKEVTDRYVSEKDYLDLYEVVGREKPWGGAVDLLHPSFTLVDPLTRNGEGCEQTLTAQPHG